MKLLSICVPTYNRKYLIKEDIEKYLSINDMRFYVKVVDNCSDDSTYDYLKSIKDERLIIKHNTTNIGPTQNMFAALRNNDSRYSLLVLDKDLLDVSLLTAFLDELDNSTEQFGFINPDMRFNKNQVKPNKLSFAKGYNSIYKMAYLNQHPSGYLYRSDLIDKVCDTSVFLSLDKDFVFPFEVINASLALENDSFIFNWPIIIRARERKNDPLSLTYNPTNIWFSASQRLYFYQIYLDSAFNLNIKKCQKKALVNYLTNNALNETTLVLRNLMNSNYACSHYRIEKKKVGLKEMYGNIILVLNSLREKSTSIFSPIYINSIIVYFYIIQLFRICFSLTFVRTCQNAKQLLYRIFNG